MDGTPRRVSSGAHDDAAGRASHGHAARDRGRAEERQSAIAAAIALNVTISSTTAASRTYPMRDLTCSSGSTLPR
jgi:hypothetical protein